MSSAGIALLTFNGIAYLSEVLKMITRQSIRPEKIMAIDSGSTDGTLELLQNCKIETHRIPQSDFSHSKTRNLALQWIDSRFIVYLTQDATPMDSCWLDQLLRPFEQHRGIAGVFSRQVARPGADLLEAHDLKVSFQSQQQIKTVPADRSLYKKRIWDYIRFSNASAAYDRKLLCENRFNENLRMGEDQDWAKRMIEKGWKIAYEPDSTVLHSHSHTIKQKYERNLEMGRAFSLFLGNELGKRHFPLPEYVYNVAADVFFMISHPSPWQNKLKWLARSPFHRAAMHYAFYNGWNSALQSRPAANENPLSISHV